jgi:hypothetical protein
MMMMMLLMTGDSGLCNDHGSMMWCCVDWSVGGSTDGNGRQCMQQTTMGNGAVVES